MISRVRILWVEVRNFYAAASAGAVVVVRGDAVLDANPVAQVRGVYEGMPLRQAKAVLQDGTFRVWKGEDYEERHRAWLDLCIEFSGVIEPADQHAAWIDLSLHPDPLFVTEKLIRALVRETGLAVRFGLGPSKWMAKLAAEYDFCAIPISSAKPKHQLTLIPLPPSPMNYVGEEELSALPTRALTPVLLEHRERLLFLGYPTIGDVAKLPLATLKDQFGEEGLRIYAAARGQLSEPVSPVYPRDSIIECLVFDGAVSTTEAVREGCALLARRVGDRLSQKGLQSKTLCVALELESGEVRRLARTFTKPQACGRSVLAALGLLIAPSLDASIASIQLLVPELEKLKLSQPSFLSVNDRDTLRMRSAVTQIKAVFGEESVLRGSEIVPPRRVRVLREWKHVTGWR